MGEVLIAGTASLLICIFLSPKFIEFLREREFGQQIREEGPQEHHAKAGTPTMGGIIIFTAIAVPFLLLTNRDPRSLTVFAVAVACALLGFADDSQEADGVGVLSFAQARQVALDRLGKLLAQARHFHRADLHDLTQQCVISLRGDNGLSPVDR